MIMLDTYIEKLKYCMQLSDANLFYLAMYWNNPLKKKTFKVVILHVIYVILCSPQYA